jgi:WD40 repeat protein
MNKGNNRVMRAQSRRYCMLTARYRGKRSREVSPWPGNVFGQVAHLLAPTDPVYSQADILCSRVSHDPDWGPQGRLLQAGRCTPALINRWPLPDLPNPWLHRTITGHVGAVSAVTVAPDGAWLAVGGEDGSVRIWDVVTWERRAELADHDDGYQRALVVAPDGTWLAAGGAGPVRIWDTATWEQRAMLTGHADHVETMAVSPDGNWLASASRDWTVRIWDPATGFVRAVMRTERPLLACTWSPDGESLAVAGDAYLCLFTFVA